MEIDKILLLRTLILLLPFTLLFGYFHFKVRDPFFLKPRTYIQIHIIMISLALVFVETVYWSLELKNYMFLGFDLNKNNDGSGLILILLGIFAAVLGWLFTYRGQVLTAIRSHSIQTLMSSRLSETYIKQVEYATEIYKKYKNERGENYVLQYEVFITLDDRYVDSIHYLLNYIEFVAVGIRFGDLDEKLMKNMMKSIVSANYNFFELIIKEKQIKTPTVYEHLTALNARWNGK